VPPEVAAEFVVHKPAEAPGPDTAMELRLAGLQTFPEAVAALQTEGEVVVVVALADTPGCRDTSAPEVAAAAGAVGVAAAAEALGAALQAPLPLPNWAARPLMPLEAVLPSGCCCSAGFAARS